MTTLERTIVVFCIFILIACGFAVWMCAQWFCAAVSPWDLIPPQSTSPAQNPVSVAPVSVGEALEPASTAEMVEISCYTGVERNGANGRVDGVSVATLRYPIGTWIEIEGIGRRRVDTVTAWEYRDRVDVWFGFDSVGCINFGVRTRAVSVLPQ